MEYIKPIILLICLLILFHVLLIKYFPQNKRFWKKVDYWWVSLGVLGIIGATFTYRKEISIAWKPLHKQSLEAVYNEYLDLLRRNSINFSDTTGNLLSLAENSIQRNNIISTGIFLTSMAKRVESFKNLVLIEERYDFVDSITTPYNDFISAINDKLVVDFCRLSTFMCARTREEANILNELRNQGIRNELNWVLLIISPYLFAIALAIRLTKVSAELVEIN